MLMMGPWGLLLVPSSSALVLVLALLLLLLMLLPSATVVAPPTSETVVVMVAVLALPEPSSTDLACSVVRQVHSTGQRALCNNPTSSETALTVILVPGYQVVRSHEHVVVSISIQIACRDGLCAQLACSADGGDVFRFCESTITSVVFEPHDAAAVCIDHVKFCPR